MVLILAFLALFLVTFLAVVWMTQRLNVDPLQDVLAPLVRELIDQGLTDDAKRHFSQLASAVFIKYGLGGTPMPMLRMRLGHALSTLLRTVPQPQFEEAQRYLLGWNFPSSTQALQMSSAGPVQKGAPAESQQVDVFISYAREDRDAIRVIAARLEALGLGVWWDHEIGTGAQWETELHGKLIAAKVVLVMWSPFSVTSEWVRREATIARENAKIVPAFLRKCRLPSNFHDLQTSDLSHWDGNSPDPEWLKITTSIEEHLLKAR